jgi:hypothetical protein
MKRTRTSEEILKGSSDRSNYSPFGLSDEAFIIKLIAWFFEWFGVRRFLFFVTLIGGVYAYFRLDLTKSLILFGLSLGLAIWMYSDDDSNRPQSL